MKKSFILLTATLGFCMFMSACVTVGHRFDTDAVAKIVIGKTTQNDISKLFGEPFRTGVDSGDTTWTYVNYHFGVFGPQQATDLVIKFNAAGAVLSYAYNTTPPEDDKK
jgi:hypothetical protein